MVGKNKRYSGTIIYYTSSFLPLPKITNIASSFKTHLNDFAYYNFCHNKGLLYVKQQGIVQNSEQVNWQSKARTCLLPQTCKQCSCIPLQLVLSFFANSHIFLDLGT